MQPELIIVGGSPEMCVARVAQRVRRGGHHVPTSALLNDFLDLIRDRKND